MAIGCLSPIGTAAQPTDAVGSMGWKNSVIEEAGSVELPEGFALALILRTFPELDDAVYKALEQRVGSLPEHPERFVLAENRRVRDVGHDINELYVWSFTPDLWRISENWVTFSLTSEQLAWHDLARMSRDRVWERRPTSLGIVDLSSPPAHSDPNRFHGRAVSQWRSLVVTGLGALPKGTRAVQAAWRGDAWEARIVSDDGAFECGMFGSRDAMGDLVIRKRVDARTADGLSPGITVHFEPDVKGLLDVWAVQGLRASTAVRVMYPDGRPAMVTELKSIAPVQSGDQAVLLAVPRSDRPDPFRPDVSFVEAVDFRGAGRSSAPLAGETSSKDEKGMSVMSATSPGSSAKSATWLPSSWSFLVGGVVFLVVLFVAWLYRGHLFHLLHKGDS